MKWLLLKDIVRHGARMRKIGGGSYQIMDMPIFYSSQRAVEESPRWWNIVVNFSGTQARIQTNTDGSKSIAAFDGFSRQRPPNVSVCCLHRINVNMICLVIGGSSGGVSRVQCTSFGWSIVRTDSRIF